MLNIKNIQPITLFAALWYVVPVLSLAEWGRRNLGRTTKDPRSPFYIFLVGVDLWAFMFANTYPGRLFSALGVGLSLMLMMDRPSQRVAAVLVGASLLLSARSFQVVSFGLAEWALVSYLSLACLWMAWTMTSVTMKNRKIPVKQGFPLVTLLTAVSFVLSFKAIVVAFIVGGLALVLSLALFLLAKDDKEKRIISFTVLLSDILILLAFLSPHS